MKKHLHVLCELTKANEINNFNKQFGAHYVSVECGQALDIITTFAESKLVWDLSKTTEKMEFICAMWTKLLVLYWLQSWLYFSSFI